MKKQNIFCHHSFWVWELKFNPFQPVLGLMDYLHYVAWASFHTFHAPCTQSVVDSWGIPLFYGVFRANIHAVVAHTTISHCRYVHGFVVLELVNFL